jgi:hypothetical protein
LENLEGKRTKQNGTVASSYVKRETRLENYLHRNLAEGNPKNDQTKPLPINDIQLLYV